MEWSNAIKDAVKKRPTREVTEVLSCKRSKLGSVCESMVRKDKHGSSVSDKRCIDSDDEVEDLIFADSVVTQPQKRKRASDESCADD